jgi:hypothetical protein
MSFLLAARHSDGELSVESKVLGRRIGSEVSFILRTTEEKGGIL